MNRTRRNNRRAQCRGVTMIEVIIAAGILGMVLMGVAFIEATSAKQTLALYGDSRTLHRAHLVLDRVRYKLMTAQVGSVVSVNDGRTIEFRDPNLALGKISMFVFREGKVFYYEDKTLAASTPGQGIGSVHDLQFTVLGAGNAVRVSARTLQTYSWRLAKPYTLDTEITLRN